MTQPPIFSDQASSSEALSGVPPASNQHGGLNVAVKPSVVQPSLVPPPIVGPSDVGGTSLQSTTATPIPTKVDQASVSKSERWKGQSELPPPRPSSRPSRGLPAAPVPVEAVERVATETLPDGSVIGEAEPMMASDDRWLAVPAWLTSLIIHTLLVVFLVIVPLAVKPKGTSVLSISMTDSPEDDSVAFETLPEELTPTDDDELLDQPAPVDVVKSIEQTPVAVSISLLPKAPTDPAGPLWSSILTESSGGQALHELPNGGMHRRDADSRKQLGKMYGATDESEDAVEAALAWLAAHQQRNGSWSFDLSHEPCNGRCRNNQREGADNARPATAATGLALLAFLGAGYSHHEGKYAETVQRGLYFLRDAAMPTDFGLDLQSGSMYGHGIAALAISEAMAMSRYNGRQDTELLGLTTKVAEFTMTAQHQLGGWRYVPGSPGDMTVSAWQILSLVSAQHGGVFLRTGTLPRAEMFIRSLSKPDLYQFGYQSQRAEPRTTAIGLCLLLYLGQSPKDVPFAKSVDGVAARGPRLTDVYHDYYATLLLHHVRHREWAAWHVPLREHLIKSQSKADHEAGSWHFKDENGDVGGRLYTTAMAAMILEVYYRYLPLYQDRGEFRLH